MATPEQIRSFNASRRADTSQLCYAPWLALNFDQTGNVTACCFNRRHILGRYPANRLREIWEGAEANALRQAMADYRFDLGCQSCERMIEEGNYQSVLISHFDDYYPLIAHRLNGHKSWFDKLFKTAGARALPDPVVFEFEISNTCNLECIMCGGKWSSAIRKNREKKPQPPNPYDQNFVEEVKQFLPNLKRANFLGGEPFLISLYYELWEAILDINPSIDVAITSNGTVMNTRAKRIIEKLPHCRITLSVDSLQKETWETIRVNGSFEHLQETMDYLLRTGKLVSFSVCPMIQNRMEIPHLIHFCADKHLDIYFNVVYEPLGGRIKGIHQDNDGDGFIPETSLQALSAAELEALIAYYRTFRFSGRYRQQLDHLIAQLEVWMQAKAGQPAPQS
ncbi:MAG: hypothetical protein KatS3mg031_0864 [Chitinophagales bacterium]|nr:MAG: hypothetical protein KatS3mg031_0864 [Chitinophagales bacterium]